MDVNFIIFVELDICVIFSMNHWFFNVTKTLGSRCRFLLCCVFHHKMKLGASLMVQG